MAGIEGRRNSVSVFLSSPVKSLRMFVASSPVPNEVFAQLPMKWGPSLPISTFFTATRAKDFDRLAALGAGL